MKWDRVRALAVWPVVVCVNGLLGYAAVIPLMFVAAAVRGTVLQPLGLAGPDPDFGEELGLNTVVALFGLFIVVGVFGTVNGGLARVFDAGRAFWAVGGLILLAPTTAVLIWPELWQVIRWY